MNTILFTKVIGGILYDVCVYARANEQNLIN